MIRKSLAFIAAASLAAAPAFAQSSASALSIAPAVERAGPSADDDSQFAGGSALPVIVAAAIVIAGVLMATGVIFDDSDSDSP